MAKHKSKKHKKVKKFSPWRRWMYKLRLKSYSRKKSPSLSSSLSKSSSSNKHHSRRHHKKGLLHKIKTLWKGSKYKKLSPATSEDTFLRTGGEITNYNPGQGRLIQEEARHKSEKRYKDVKKKYKAPKKRKSQDIGGASKLKRNFNKLLYTLYLTDVPYDPWLQPDRDTQPAEKKERHWNPKAYIPYVFNSTILYVLAYLLVYLSYQLAVIITAGNFGIDSVLYYYEVMFPVGNNSPLWTDFSIIAITLSGPLISLLLGILYYRYFLKKRQPANRMVKLFLIWLSFHSFNMFLGAWTAGIITDQGFGYVANWLYLPTAAKFFLSLVFVFLMAFIGFKSTQAFLETANSSARIRKSNRPWFILSQAVLPWLIGTGILLAIKIPNATPQHHNIIVYDAILLFSILALIVPMFFNAGVHPRLGAKQSRSRTRTNFLWLMLAVLMIVLYRIGLSHGLHFIINIDISISPY